jgi:hypothetical protein
MDFCFHCNKPLLKYQKKYCSNKCQMELVSNLIIEKWKKGEITGLKAGRRIVNTIRIYLLNKFEHKCGKCGWNEKNPVTNKAPLEVNHIDGNSNNNLEENLEIICPNCHSLTPTWKALNKGKGNKERLRYSKLLGTGSV